MSPRPPTSSAHRGRSILSALLVGVSPVSLVGCVALFDVPPGKLYETGPDGRPRDACTDHDAAIAGDILLGTLALAGGLLGFGLADDFEGFAGVGIVGVGGAIGHYASAGSSKSDRCRRVLENSH
jgi:hypothetical protein